MLIITIHKKSLHIDLNNFELIKIVKAMPKPILKSKLHFLFINQIYFKHLLQLAIITLTIISIAKNICSIIQLVI